VKAGTFIPSEKREAWDERVILEGLYVGAGEVLKEIYFIGRIQG